MVLVIVAVPMDMVVVCVRKAVEDGEGMRE